MPDSLGVFVNFAIDGVGQDVLYGAAQVRGSQAARELLRYLTDLPASAGCQNVEQFLVGYTLPAGAHHEDVAKWKALLSEVFSLAMVDLAAAPIDPLEYGHRLMSVIREAANLASPRLLAWGVPPA
jgi:hypothetical protein